jgi:hypothetical protein
VGEVGLEAVVPFDQVDERVGLLDRQVVLGPAVGAGEVDVASLLGPVVLGAGLQVAWARTPISSSSESVR